MKIKEVREIEIERMKEIERIAERKMSMYVHKEKQLEELRTAVRRTKNSSWKS